MSEGLVLGGGDKPKKRSGRASDWTEAKADRFVAVLAETCNVTLAARAIRRSISNIYKQRGKDANFRAAWDQALAIGYSRLEMMLLERALHGVEKKVIKNGETTVMREYSDRVALTLLRMHRETVAAAEDGVGHEEYQEACERIIAKLERLREREHGAVATKCAVDRIALIRWALRVPAKGTHQSNTLMGPTAGAQTGSLPSRGHRLG